MSGSSGRLWGGRFAGEADPALDAFTRSFGFDRRLAKYDLIGSLAHAQMLGACGVLDRADAERIVAGLSALLQDLESGRLEIDGDDEDVHTWIERLLSGRIGEAGRRLHTARSRNDQTATALRLYVRARLLELSSAIERLIDALVERASGETETWLPGYTHTQRGQPVSLAHHLLAHAWSLVADGGRIRRAYEAAGSSPLGAAALAGTVHGIDPAQTAEMLGFERVFENSMHAVADRDYVVECSFSCALLMVHLSRWAEELILWSSREFGFVRLDDRIAKGSSIMPQKKNPEAAEVLRGKSGRVIGTLTAHLVQLKGLPLTYNSDLQEDKEALFDAVDTAEAAIAAAIGLFDGVAFERQAMAAALRGGFVTATDLADALVRVGVPFRDAHAQVGRAVQQAERSGLELWELGIDQLVACCPAADAGMLAALDPAASVRAHASPGGPAPTAVERQLEQARRALGELREWRELQSPPPIYAAHLEGRLVPVGGKER